MLVSSQVGYHTTHGKFNRHTETLDETDPHKYPKSGYDRCDNFCWKRFRTDNVQERCQQKDKAQVKGGEVVPFSHVPREWLVR